MKRERTKAQEYQAIAAVYRYHTQHHKWPGIGYWYMVFESGNIYQTGSLTDQRASVSKQNHHIVGVAMVGNFNKKAPNQRHIAAVRYLKGVVEGEVEHKLSSSPHRAYVNTQCPGDTWPSWGVLI